MYLYGEEAWICIHCERLTYPQFNERDQYHHCQHCGGVVTKMIDCPQCGGTSFLGDDICPHCDGADFVYQWIKKEEEQE